MRKISVILLAGFLLALAGCAKEPVVSGMPLSERLYSIYNGDSVKIVNGTGEVVLQGEYPNTTVIRDELSKKPLYIQMIKVDASAERNEYGEPAAYNYTQALYDTNGTLLFDYGEANYGAAFGDYLFVYGNNGDSRLVNMKTGETAYDGVINLMRGNSSVMILTQNDNTLIVMDAQGQVLGSKKGIRNAYFASQQRNDYIIAADTDERYGLIDKNCQTVLDFVYYQVYEVFGNYALVEKDGVFQAIDLTTKQVVLERPERIGYFDGTVGILTQRENQQWVEWLIDPAGNAISNKYDSITYNLMYNLQDGLPISFIGRKDNNRNGKEDGILVDVLDHKGQVFLSKTSNSGEGLWIEPLSANRYIVSIYRNGSDSAANIVNEKGEEILPAKYAYIYPAYGQDGQSNSYLWGSFFTPQGALLMDLLDSNGNVKVANLKNDGQYFCDGARVIGSKGFAVGLMDLNGKWIYKESVFSALDND